MSQLISLWNEKFISVKIKYHSMKTILTIWAQIFLFYLTVNLLWLIFGLFIENFSYPDNYVLITSIILFSFLVILQHIMTGLIKNHKFRMIINIIIISACFLIWGEDFKSFPYIALMFCFSSAISILSRQLIWKTMVGKI